MEDHPGLSGWAQCNHREEGEDRRQRQRLEGCHLNTVEAATSQGVQMAPQSWKDEDKHSPPGASKEKAALWTP